MNGPLHLVTGASGRTGAVVVAQLRERAARVRAVVHRNDARRRALAELGAEIVVADLFDPQEVAAVMAGVDRVYVVPLWHPHALHSAVVLATEARRARVEAVVHLSQWLANPAHPSLLTRQQWLTEQLLELLPDTIQVTVNPGFFADNYLGNGLIGLAAQLGVMPLPLGRARNAPPSTEDIARVVTAVLLDPAPHAGRRYRPTGPALLTPVEIADTIGEALGRRVRYVDMPERLFLRALRVLGPRAGIGTAQLAELRWYYQESRLGTWEQVAPTTDVHDVTGADPEDFATIARRYAARPEARRTARNTARAVVDTIRIGITPGPRLDREVRRQHQPMPPRPALSAPSSTWAQEHAPAADASPRAEAVLVGAAAPPPRRPRLAMIVRRGGPRICSEAPHDQGRTTI